MTQPNKPQANAVTTKMGRIRSDEDPLAPENVPNVEFIDISSNKPVDPTRFQIFQLPHQFLEWVLAKEPPHLDPENLKDTGPHGMSVHQKKLVPNVMVPVAGTDSDSVQESSRRLLPDSRVAVHEPVRPPRATTQAEQVTTEMAARHQIGLFARWSLTGRMPRRVKVLLAAIVGGLLLILFWRHLDSSSDPQVVSSEGARALVALPAVPTAAVEPAASVVVAEKPVNEEPSFGTDRNEVVAASSAKQDRRQLAPTAQAPTPSTVRSADAPHATKAPTAKIVTGGQASSSHDKRKNSTAEVSEAPPAVTVDTNAESSTVNPAPRKIWVRPQ